MKIAGNLEVAGTLDGLQLKPSTTATIPIFNSDDKGALYFDTDINGLVFNNGVSNLNILLDETSNPTFRDTLGAEWINVDYTFNPTNFNNLGNISGLTSSSTLYNVIQQLDTSITSQKISTIDDLSDATITNAVLNDILYNNGSEWINGSINNIISSISYTLSDADDTTIATPVNGDKLVYSDTSNTFENKKTSHTFDTATVNTIFGITHNLNTLHCHVTVINKLTNISIPDAVVTYVDADTLQISIGVSAPIIALISIP